MYKKVMFLPVICVVFSFFSVVESASNEVVSNSKQNNINSINVLQFGAKGDGVTDDTVALQRAFEKCSDFGLICKIPKDKTFLVTEPLYLWGKASLIGEDDTGVIEFRVFSSPYLLNIGISGKNKIEEVFSGVISGVNFKVTDGKMGRIIFFWRTQGASLVENIFDVGNYRYSATSSGNNNRWLKEVNDYVRKNIIIKRNKIIAAAGHLGSEGIGLGDFDGAIISENTITGVGDDPIGIHYSKNIEIENNLMKSVDGRLYVSNSVNVNIQGNTVQRIASPLDNKFHRGISLIYIGFELHNINNSFSAPENINVYDNDLYYPPGSIDAGAAIYLYGPRNINVGKNKIINDSQDVIATAVHILPAIFSAKWKDPDKIDESDIARVWDLTVFENVAGGKFPQKIIMTGNCVDYMGSVLIRDNLAKGYQFYCPKIGLFGNKKHVTTM